LLKPVKQILDEAPLLAQENIAFLQWVAAYYHHPSGEVILSALPAYLRKGESQVSKTEKAWQLTDAGRQVQPEQLKRSVRQQRVIQFFQEKSIAIGRQELGREFTNFQAAVKSLIDKGYLQQFEKPLEQDFAKQKDKWSAPQLHEQQERAVDAVLKSSGFDVSLLYGITGSGKTEVYLAIVDAVLARGLQVMILVPEIALTPQLLKRFEHRMKEPMVILHSGLAEKERAYAWQQASNGKARLVLGTRSAIFTPLPDLGLIVVDEEHDQSYKQQEGFRYSARDMAVALGKEKNCPVILGSATPSFESLQNAYRGNYRLLKMTERALNASLPSIELVDIRSVRLDGGFSPVSRRLISEELDKGNQVMVFLNRRGYAPVLTCHDCGWVAQCHRCDSRMTVHVGKNRLWCHHCGHQQRIPVRCPDCEHENMTTLGQGTEQIESVLNRYFPDTSCVRIDHDSTRIKGSMHEKLESVRDGKYQLLVGTQMLAKGHDFPNVTLVVVMDVDAGLYGTDFRSSERMSQLLMQVAGRSGRAEKKGRVIIQTRHPDHPLLHVLIHQGYEAFSQQALSEREQASFPPFGFQVLMRAEASRADLPEEFLEAARSLPGKPGEHSVEFWGPVPAAMQRKKGVHRFHLLLQSPSRARLHQFLDQWLPEVERIPQAKRVRWSIDIDPQDFYS
jgi:primosomal protein N' (replication factor Y)